MKGAASAPVRIPLTAPQPLPPPRYVTVQNGQTIERIASLYHVSRSAIVALNGLRPPYKPQPGARLMIPNTDEAAAQAAAHRPPPLRSQIAVAAPLPLPGEASVDWASADAAQAAAPGNAAGRFPWPVRGRVLANYGSTTAGGHNDGINIAAARGEAGRPQGIPGAGAERRDADRKQGGVAGGLTLPRLWRGSLPLPWYRRGVYFRFPCPLAGRAVMRASYPIFPPDPGCIARRRGRSGRRG